MKKVFYRFLSMTLVFSLFFLASSFLSGCQTNHLEGLDGTWFLNDNSVFVIRDNEFYWYESNTNPNDNFYYGDNLKVLYGEEAVDAIKVPSSNREELLKTHIYHLSVVYTQYHLNGEDLSNQLTGDVNEFAIQIATKDRLNIMHLNTNLSYTAYRSA